MQLTPAQATALTFGLVVGCLAGAPHAVVAAPLAASVTPTTAPLVRAWKAAERPGKPDASAAKRPGRAMTEPARTPVGVKARARTNYYVDNDGNQIVTPLVAAEAVVNETTAVQAHAVLDVMTCASVDVVTAATPLGYFQETRKEAGGGVSVRRDLTTIAVSGIGSLENDYSAATGAISISQELAKRNTTLALAYSFTDSDVGRAYDPNYNRDLDSHAVTLSMTQVLSRQWIAQASGFAGFLNGMQSSVYRMVRFTNGTFGAEVVPDERMRFAGAVQVRGALARKLFVGGSYRLYSDDWGMLAHTGELTAFYTVNSSFTVRLRDRLHVQRGVPFYQSRFGRPFRYMTADRELGDFYGNLVGIKLSANFAEPSRGTELSIDAKVDGMWQVFDDFPWLPERRMLMAEVGVALAF